jgi:hypothetical protein
MRTKADVSPTSLVFWVHARNSVDERGLGMPLKKGRGPDEGGRASDKHLNSALVPLGKCFENTKDKIGRCVDLGQ